MSVVVNSWLSIQGRQRHQHLPQRELQAPGCVEIRLHNQYPIPLINATSFHLYRRDCRECQMRISCEHLLCGLWCPLGRRGTNPEASPPYHRTLGASLIKKILDSIEMLTSIFCAVLSENYMLGYWIVYVYIGSHLKNRDILSNVGFVQWNEFMDLIYTPISVRQLIDNQYLVRTLREESVALSYTVLVTCW